MIDGRRNALLVVGGLVAIVFAAYLRPLVVGDTFALRDHVTLTVPARAHLAESIAGGSVPEWWDGVGLGVSFGANPMHGATYPPAWIVAALPEPFGADLLAILHVLLLGVGTALVSRRLGADALGAVVAGGAMMCCGYTASMVVNGIPLISMAWTPWVAWAAEGVAAASGLRQRLRSSAIACALYAALIASGDPAAAITTGLLALVWVGTRAERDRWRAVAAMAAALAGATILAAATIVPAMQVLGESRRAGGLSAEVAGAWSLHPLRGLELVSPHALGDPTETERHLAVALANTAGDEHMDPGWSLSLYLGAPVLLLAWGAARGRLRALAIGSAVFVVLALGVNGYVWTAYRYAFLPERVIRYPERHILGALVIWTALAGVGFTRAFRERGAPDLWRTAAGATGVLVAWVVVAFGLSNSVDVAIDDPNAAWSAVLLGGVAAVIVTGLFAAALWLARGERYRAALPAAAAALIVGQLIGHGWSVQPLIPRAELDAVPALVAQIPNRGASPAPRLYRHRSVVPSVPVESRAELVVALYHTAVANTATRFGVAYVPGYDPSIPARVRALWDAGAARGNRLMRRFDVEYAVVRKPARGAPGPNVIAETSDGQWALVRVTGRRPRAFTTSSWLRVSPDAPASRVFDDDARDAVVLYGEPEDHREPAAAIEPCRVDVRRPEHVVLHCTAAAPGYAVLLDAWAPGWSATVDGAPARIERADHIVRAVAVDAGSHVVDMRYRTPGLRAGAIVALLGWLCWIALMIGLRRWVATDA